MNTKVYRCPDWRTVARSDGSLLTVDQVEVVVGEHRTDDSSVTRWELEMIP